MKNSIGSVKTAAAVIAAALVLMSRTGYGAEEKDAHAGHDHGAGEPQVVNVTRDQVQRMGIKISPVKKGVMRRELRVPGEIKFNSDRLAHVVPRASGIVREVLRRQGDAVRKGEVLAWIESDDLAEAKLEFFARESEVGCCEVQLPRAKEIFGNVAKLTELLMTDAPEESLRALDGLEMGRYRGILLPAYAEFRKARATYERESALHARKISSLQELIEAESALESARAGFYAAVDTARFESRIA